MKLVGVVLFLIGSASASVRRGPPPRPAPVLAFARDDVPARPHTSPLYDRFARVERDLAGEPGVAIVGDHAALSALGWPVRVLERLVTAIARRRDELVAAMLDGRPDWSGGVACLAELLPEP